MKKCIVVFVHGWSVTDTATYGGLPVRLRNEARAAGMEIRVKQIFLGRYISFHDEVRVKDISRAFHTAVADELSGLSAEGNRFVCITHSTGGPVIRDWWHRYYGADTGGGNLPDESSYHVGPCKLWFGIGPAGQGKTGSD